MPVRPTGPTCAEASRSSGELLAGNATAETHIWLLLEVPGSWAREAIASPGIDEPLRRHLQGFLDANAGSRLQLIRRPGHRAASPACFIGVSSEASWLLELSLDRLDDLLDIDLSEVIATGRHARASERRRPLHLVCTHGRRDTCCATFGQPLYAALAACDASEVWQTTHVGGHRFAGCVISLPQGYCYGRVEPEAAGDLLAAHRKSELFDLRFLRGRTCYAAPTQAAEIELRRELGLVSIDALSHLQTRPAGGGHEVSFSDGERVHRVKVDMRAVEAMRPKSCGDEPSSVEQFETVQLGS